MKTKFSLLMFFSFLFIHLGRAQSTNNWSNQYDEVGKFYDGLAWVKLDYKYGFVDQTGKKITPLKYDFVGDFSEGLAMVVEGILGEAGGPMVRLLLADRPDKIAKNGSGDLC